MKKLIFFLLLLIGIRSFSQTIDFETSVPVNFSGSANSLSMSNDHYRIGSQSLKWNWKANDVLTINNPVINSSQVVDYDYHTTELWIYNENYSTDKITFEYLDAANVVNFNFDFILNFVGWRRVARSYRYDMNKIPGFTTSISKIRIKAPNTNNATGNLFFDDWEYVKSRYTRIVNRQMPDINDFLSDSLYYYFDSNDKDIPLATPSTSEITDYNTIKTNLINDLKGSAPSSLSTADAYYNSLNITVNGNQIKGLLTSPAEANSYLYAYARDYYHNKTASSLTKAENMIWLINDLGFAGGSDLVYGWYDTREYFSGLLLIYPYLSATTKVKVFDAVQWTLKMGELWDPKPMPGWNSDYIHTNLKYMLGAVVICIEDDQEAIRYLKGMKRYLERKNIASSGHAGWLKPDGTSFHHNAHYNAYMYSFSSYTNVLNMLKTTQFQINSTAYLAFREAAYNLIVMCNNTEFANSLSGRHPFAVNIPMDKTSYNRLAYIGGEILGQTVDLKIAAAYNRIWNDDTGLSSVSAESFPTGFWQFNYSPIGIFRKNNWVSTIHGINAKFWGTEIYSNENRLGRYQSYGAVEVMYTGGKINSGMSINGYNWNRVPGTTTKELDWTLLNPSDSRADEYSNLDYAAALRFDELDENKGNFGMYGFDFQQKAITTKHDTSFKFKKSIFCFDDMIICLGSNISCSDATNPIITTLFQNSLPTTTSAIVENGTSQTTFPYTDTLLAGTHWLLDAWNTGFWVKNKQNLMVLKQNQSTMNQTVTGTSSGNFATAYINHGTSPNNLDYEFVIKPNTNTTAMNSFSLSMQNNTTALYSVIQKDANAHIVYHKASNIFGYSFFKANSDLNNSVIKANNFPCLVMLNEIKGILKLSLVDPSTSYLQNKTIQLQLNGNYTIQTADVGVSLISTGNGTTTLNFTPREGFAQDVVLQNTALTIDNIIYPNPNSKKLIFRKKTQDNTVFIYSQSEQLLSTTTLKQEQDVYYIDIANLPVGTYFIVIGNEKYMIIKI